MKKKAVLVYQGGLANIFEVNCFNMKPYGRGAIRILQKDFNSCVMFALGLKAAGYSVKVAGCNVAGDIVDKHWTSDLDDLPFSESFCPYDKANNDFYSGYMEVA